LIIFEGRACGTNSNKISWITAIPHDFFQDACEDFALPIRIAVDGRKKTCKPVDIENTLWNINMEPKNGGLEDDFPFQLGDFYVPAVNFQGCILYHLIFIGQQPPQKNPPFIVNSQSSNPSQLGEFSSMMQVFYRENRIHLWTCSTTHGKMAWFFSALRIWEENNP